MSESWRAEAQKIGQRFNLEEEQYAGLENEIFMVLLIFEPQKDLAENIKNEVGIDSNIADWITEDADKNIFSKAGTEFQKLQNQEIEQKKQPSNNVGNGFKKTILNQARAMRKAQAPTNLPTTSAGPRKIHDYMPGKDPYRETIE
jgi:hypothetical protein